MDVKDLKYDDKGLIPVIIQDFYTKQVLTLAYMNQESLSITLKEGKTCFFSRSRNKLWRKGETSGNYQHVVSIRSDCDNDSLLIEVIKDGPACHLGNESCFSNMIIEDKNRADFSYEKLYYLLEQRNINRPENSYTTYLFEKGKEKILKKVGEETSEVIIAAMKDSKEETVYEIADLCYHTLVLMVSLGISLSDVSNELAKRQIINKKNKQETMK